MSQKKTSYDSFYLFRDVMRNGSFQKAAVETGQSVASISKKIAQMESELRFSLFEKGSNGMAPTAAGLFLYDKLDSILWNLDSVLQQARTIPAEDSMRMNIGISDTLPSSCYRNLIMLFAKTYPEISITLSSPPWKEMNTRLVDGRMDAAISYSVGLTGDPRLTRKPLTRSKPHLYYSDQILGSRSGDVSLEAFRDCTFICLDTDVAAMNMLRGLPFEPNKVLFADSLKTLFLYVTAGLACTVLGPAQTLKDMEGVCFLELSHMDYNMGIDLIWEKSCSNPALSLLIDCAERTYQPIERGDMNDPI